MANIPIWPGSGSFTSGSSTPFGFYDSDTAFQDDAPKLADWCAKRLGYPLVDIELQAINFFTCFEEAVNEYGAQLYNFQIINNFQTLEGTLTGSLGPDERVSNLNDRLITPNLGGVVNLAEHYGSEVDGGGGNLKIENGTLKVKRNVQKYDLLLSPSSSLFGPNSGKPNNHVYIKKIYHYAPSAINRYFDPYAGTGTGIQSLMQTFGFGNYSPGVNFMLMPMYFDALKLQAIEMNDKIRKSAYHFELQGKHLKLFPIPTSDYTLWFEYTMANSSNDLTLDEGEDVAGEDVPKPTHTITDQSNVPYVNPTYSYINAIGRQWIRKYTLALAKEMLGSVRGKYQSVPIPGDETTLDYSRLLDEARAEKEALIIQLREDLDETTTLKQQERNSNTAAATQDTLSTSDPYQIYIH